MINNAQFGVTVTLTTQTVTGYDEGNRPIYGTVTSTVHGVIVWPQTTSENVNQEDITTDLLNCMFPETIDATATVTLPDLGAYQVQGVPFHWVSPLTGTSPGWQITLKRVA